MAETPSMVGESRPTTAHSDASFATALERPLSPHVNGALTHGIDRIISLVSAQKTIAHRRSSSIASQASLDRNASYPSPTQADVIHELESLKELLDYAQPASPRLSSVVPANESNEKHDHHVLAVGDDGRELYDDAAFARAREDLLLRAAERRVKGLIAENVDLHHTLRVHQEEIEAVKAQKQTADSSLQDAQSNIADLQDQLRRLLQSSQEQQSLIDTLRSDKQRSDSAYEDERSSQRTITSSLKEKVSKIPQLILPGEVHEHIPREAAPKKSKGRSRSAAPKSRQSSAANDDLEKQLAEVELLLIDLEGKKARNDALAKEVEGYKSQLEAATREKDTFESQLQMIEAKYTKSIEDLRAQIQAGREKSDAALEDIKTSHARAVEDQKIQHAQEMERLHIEHAEQASLANTEHSRRLDSSEDALRLSKDKEIVLERRIRELTDEVALRQAPSPTTDEALIIPPQANQDTELDRRTGQAEVRNLKKRHQEAIAQIRATAQRQLDNQRVELEQGHQAALAAALATAQGAAENQSTETSVRYQSEITRLEGEHRLRVAELETRNQEKITFELLLKEDAIKAEMRALQDRLDASLTGQAEAERSIAQYRQQKFEADKRLADAEASFKKRFEAVQLENDAVTQQLKRTQSSLQELEEKSADVPKSATTDKTQELSSAKVQLGNLEKSRAETQALWQKALEEKSELIRQNDFLVKELEALLTQRSKPRASANNRKEASVQTDNDWPVEPKADLAGMKQWKQERPHAKPPASPISPTYQQVQDEIETAWENRTFEHYLSSANADLPELERTISANQVLFAGKLHEHLSDMQQARHHIAVDYQAKLNNLASEKDQMDKMVTSSHISTFAEEHERLIDRLGSSLNGAHAYGSPGTPIDDVAEVRLAEQQLVLDFDRRLVERKSQIALQYAAKFQAMTQEYDQEISRLLHKGQPAAALDTTPHHQNSPLSARSVRSVHSVKTNDDAETLRSPVTPDGRSTKFTSTPRSLTSIPRAVLYPGNRHSPDATSQPRSAPSKAHHRNWHSVAQHSLMRAKSPAGILKTPSSITSDKSSDTRSISSPLREKSSNISNEENVPPSPLPATVAADNSAAGTVTSDGKDTTPIPLPRASMESSIPRPGIPTRAKERKSIGPGNPLRTKSMRHSSGMIYYHAPRQGITHAP